MRWSIRLGQVAGIGIFVHWTFLILIAWIVFAHYVQGNSLAVAARGLALVIAIFGCIVLHELGHALTARRFGISTRDITLYPIGGIARLERMPDDPTQELLVALAGPAVNVVIAALLVVVLLALGVTDPVASLTLVGGSFMAQLAFVNIFIVLFNLLPAFPMDGGRVLRALLARKLEYSRATEIAATVGQFMAMLFAVVGIFVGNWILLVIALFVYFGGQQEAYATQIRTMLQGVPTRDAMVTRFRTLGPDDRLATVVDELLAGEQQDFPVLQQDLIVGVLGRNIVLQHLAEGQRDVHVGEIMRRDCPTVPDSAMLDDTFARMREDGCSMMPVVRNGQLVGIVTLENVGEWMMIQSALRKARARSDVGDIYRPG